MCVLRNENWKKGLQSAVCGLHFVLTGLVLLPVFVRASLKSGPKYWSSKKNPSETVLAARIDMWTVCSRAYEEKYNDRAMITLYQLKSNANARLTNIATSGALSRGHSVCSASRFKLHFHKFGNVI